MGGASTSGAEEFRVQPCGACGALLEDESQVHRSEYANIGFDDDLGSNDVELLYCFACTWLQNRETVLTEVRRSVEAIRDGQHTRMFNDLWRHGNEALMWLYMIDNHYESHVRRRTDYAARKMAEAPALLGLIWARGAAQHGHLWEFEGRGMRRHPGDLFYVPVTVWKAHPEDKKRKPAERTLWQHYDEHVADREIAGPLTEAEGFVSALDESFWFPVGVDRRSRR